MANNIDVRDAAGTTRTLKTTEAAGVHMPHHYVEEQGGAYTTPTHSVVNVNGNTVALAANANRLYALLVNESDATIYIKLGAAAVVNEGIPLNANGGAYEMSAKFGNLYRGTVNAIHGGTGGKVLLVTEGA